jgi:hypothetical protein
VVPKIQHTGFQLNILEKLGSDCAGCGDITAEPWDIPRQKKATSGRLGYYVPAELRISA